MNEVYSDFVAMALEMISDFGGPCTFTQTQPGEIDPDEPWKTGDPVTVTKPNVPVAFFPAGTRNLKKASIILQTDIPAGVEEAYTALIDGYEPTVKDTITKSDGVVYSIISFDRIDPNNGGAILYVFLVRQ